MNKNLHLKSSSKHDEAILAVMAHMIESHPNATITMASSNVINVTGNGLGPFLKALVNQVPVLNMNHYQSKRQKQKQFKHKMVDNGGAETHCIHFTFYELDYRERMNIPPNQAVNLGVMR